MRARRLKPFDVVPGKDVFGNVVNPGDAITMATKSYGSAYINKGRYLGSRKLMDWGRERFCYVVEQDRIHTERTNADGENWCWYGYGQNPTQLKQKQELESAIGSNPVKPTSNLYDRVVRSDAQLLSIANAEWDAHRIACIEYDKKKQAWLDEHYPYKSTPYVRRSTLWLNKIIKL